MRIHYIWLQGETELPEKYRENIRITQNNYPTAEIKIWNQEELESLVKQCKYLSSDLLQKIHWIQLVDIGRVLVLYKYGGLYLDTDTSIPRKMDFDETKLYLVRSDYSSQAVRNWLIHSPKRHVLWKYYLKNLNIHRWLLPWVYYVAVSTGGLYISKLLHQHPEIQYISLKENEFDNAYDSSWHFGIDCQDLFWISIIVLAIIFIVMWYYKGRG